MRSGDKIAQYGLVGLVTGGAAVAAVKFWKPLMKFGIFIIAAIAAVAAKLKSFFTGRKTSQA